MPSRPDEACEIAVTLLGRFAMTVGGIPVPEASWKRRHAAALVKVLALVFPVADAPYAVSCPALAGLVPRPRS